MRGYFVVRQRAGFPKEYMTSTGAWTDRQVAAVVFTLADEASFEMVVSDSPQAPARWQGSVVVQWDGGQFWYPDEAQEAMGADIRVARVFNHVNHARNSLRKHGFSDERWKAVPVVVGEVSQKTSLVRGYQPITLFPKSR